MAHLRGPRRRLSGDTVSDNERKVSYALERNVSIFELRYKRRYPFDQKYFGFDDIMVRRIDRPNSYDVQIKVSIEKATEITFSPNDENVLMAYIPDTPKNRKLLALMFYEADFVITRLIKPDGEVPAMQIQREIQQYATELGVRPPDPRQRNFRRNAPAVKPRLTNIEQVEAQVFAKHERLIATLKLEHGEDFRKSGIYQGVVKAEILDLCKTLNIQVQGAQEESRPMDKKPAESRLGIEVGPGEPNLGIKSGPGTAMKVPPPAPPARRMPPPPPVRKQRAQVPAESLVE